MQQPFYKIQMFYDTNSNWTNSNPYIPKGIPIYVTDLDKYKIGKDDYYNNTDFANNIKKLIASGGASISESPVGSGNWVLNVTASGTGNMLQENYANGAGQTSPNPVDKALYANNAGASTTATSLANGRSFEYFPVGSIFQWALSSAPSHTLILDGSAISRTTYSDLFALYGTTFGTGNGSTTFNLPDWRGVTPVGRLSGDTDFGTLGAKVGAKTHYFASPISYASGTPYMLRDSDHQTYNGAYGATETASINSVTNFTNPGTAQAVQTEIKKIGIGGIQPSVVCNYIVVY